jgi:UDP-3-O-[3-hydroxymyristoyl] glucosamine N-acyltransferase
LGTVVGGGTTIGNSTVKHKLRIGNKVIIGSGASVIDDIPDEDIVAGVPAKSIKHKVNSNQLFLMAGQINPSDKIKHTKHLLHY